MNSDTKTKLVFLFFSAVLGMIVGGIIWLFLRVVHVLTELIWAVLPSVIPIPVYSLFACLIGGVLIGLLQESFGPCPDNLEEVMTTFRRKGRYPYKNLPILLLAALLPLIFGGAVGPEAGLAGVVVGLCCWASDNIRYAGKSLPELADVGFSATLGVLFKSPLFGFIEPTENENEEYTLPDRAKTTAIFIAIVGGLGIFVLLGRNFGQTGGFPRFDQGVFARREMIYCIPIFLASVVLGFFYLFMDKATSVVAEKIGHKYLVMCILVGACLGFIGIFFPITMFSGEDQLTELAALYNYYKIITLIGVAFLKVFLINVCINLGWRGGSFFPLIFAGVSLGYGLSVLFSTNVSFTVAVASAGVMSIAMKKPLAVSLLLLLLFPAGNLVYILAAAFIASFIPVPKVLSKESVKA